MTDTVRFGRIHQTGLGDNVIRKTGRKRLFDLSEFGGDPEHENFRELPVGLSPPPPRKPGEALTPPSFLGGKVGRPTVSFQS